MTWFNRILVLTLILCLSHIPVPWGHSHSGMDAGQLALHLLLYHLGTGENDLPQGWHAHVTQIELSTDGEAGSYPIAVLEESFGISLTTLNPGVKNFSVAAWTTRSHASALTDVTRAHAVRQQQTYLRLNVLLI